MQKDIPPEEYETINLVTYARVIKKRKRLIAFTLMGAIIIAGIVSTAINRSRLYESKAELALGTVNAVPLVSQAEVIHQLANSGAQAAAGDDNLTIIASVKNPVAAKAQDDLTKVIDSTLREHAILYEARVKFVDEQLQRDKQSLQEIQGYLPRLQAIAARLSIPDSSSVSALQFYFFLKNQRDGLQNTIQVTETQRLSYIKTQLKEPIQTQEVPPVVGLPLALAFGLLLGLIIGVITAFTKEWWENNKQRI